MSGEPVRSQRDVHMSDAEREGVVARLNAAVVEGRLTLSEFDERVDGVFRARTFGEVEPYLANLPASTALPSPDDVVVLHNQMGQVRRTGRWAVPRKLVVRSKAGSIKLDLRHAVLRDQVVEIELHTHAGNVTIVLPAGATSDIDRVRSSAGTASVKVPAVPEPHSTAPHVVVSGSISAGSLVVRYERRIFHWRY